MVKPSCVSHNLTNPLLRIDWSTITMFTTIFPGLEQRNTSLNALILHGTVTFEANGDNLVTVTASNGVRLSTTDHSFTVYAGFLGLGENQ